MKRIFKYPLAVTDEQTIDIIYPARILSVKEQNDVLVLYAVVEDIPGWKYQKVKVFIRGTGNPMSDAEDAYYIDTVLMANGLVWHVFYTR